MACWRRFDLYQKQPFYIHVIPVFQAIFASCNNKILVDGFPRNQDNVDGWNRQMKDKVLVNFVLFFDCPEEVNKPFCSAYQLFVILRFISIFTVQVQNNFYINNTNFNPMFKFVFWQKAFYSPISIVFLPFWVKGCLFFT